MNIILKLQRNKIYLVILSFFIISFISPLLFIHTHYLFGASDMQFHLQRFAELNINLHHNNLSPIFSFNYFHGAAVMGMYPYVIIIPLLLAFSFLHLSIQSIYTYYLVYIIIVFLSLNVSFLSSRKFSKSNIISYIFSITYSMSSSILFEMFTTGDLGVVTSLIFMPLVIFGFLEVISGSKSYFMLTLGLVLMSYCQLAAVLITVLFLVLCILINIKNMNKQILLCISKSIILTSLLSCIIWIPILYLSLLNQINTVSYHQLRGTNMKFFLEYVSIFSICAIILGFLYFNKLTKTNKEMFLLSLLIILISSKLMPWKLIDDIPILSKINYFQFTFRFLIIPQLLLCYLFSFIIYNLVSKKDARLIFSILILVIILVQIFSQALVIHRKESLFNFKFDNYSSVERYEKKYNYLPHQGYLFKNNRSLKYFIDGYTPNHDYYPKRSMSKLKYILNNEATYDNKVVHIKHIGYNQFLFNDSRRVHHLVLPLLHYKGEHLYVYVNHHLVHYQTNRNNLITLSNVNSGNNKIKVQYVPNVLLLLLKNILFFIGLIWLIIILVRDHVDKIHKLSIKVS